MKLLPLFIIALMVTAPIMAGTDVYSFTKTEFGSGSFSKLVDLNNVYTETAIKIRVTGIDTLTGVSSSSQSVYVGLGDSSASPSVFSDLPITVRVDFDSNQIRSVWLYYKGSIVAKKEAPEEVPREIVIEIQAGKMSCDELGVKDFGVGSLTINAIYGRATYWNGSSNVEGVANWEAGYLTIEISKEVGFSGIWKPITPAIKLYIYCAVLVLVIGTLVGALNKAFRW